MGEMGGRWRSRISADLMLSRQEQNRCFNYTLGHWRYDCNARTFALLVSVHYKTDGAVLDSTQVPVSQVEQHDIAPETIGETMLNLVCH